MRQIILNFHGIGQPRRTLEPGEDRYWISRDIFRTVLDLVVAEAETAKVSFTFDDGNLSDLDIGAEDLARQGWSATFFVLSSRIGQPGSLGAGDIRALRAMGHRIGSHGADHVDWTRLDAAGQQREFVEARDRIATILGEPVESAAIPFGRYDGSVVRALRRHGYRAAYSSDGGHWRQGQFPAPRTSLRADMTPASITALLRGREAPLRRMRRATAMMLKKRI